MTQNNYSQQLTDLSAINLSFNETGKKDLDNILEDCYKQLGTFHEFVLCSKDPLSKKTKCLTGLLAIQRNLLKLTQLVLKPNSEDNSGLFAKLPEKQWPKLIFYNIPNNLTENGFIDHVSDNIKNELPSENWFKQTFKIGDGNKDTVNWIIESHPLVRKLLISKRKIYINWLACPVKLTRWYKCQRFGHIVKYCRSNNQCGNCSSTDHETNDCIHKNNKEAHKCANCLRAGKKLINHPANSNTCPIYLLRYNDYIQPIDYNA
ncbi:hypothetical protein ILUMI_16553 [Ignelater luminosus]|uniref:CCHC-type domain-containing protein n=1 Tax=Ignelater luminosus TaxID=2038154 RepID=A0A8K0G2R9_IGNLU|nr:hypothetical protein ILUMI_16553 [Ignelater luminosus]